VARLAGALWPGHNLLQPLPALDQCRGGLTTKIHALTDGEGLSVKFMITPGDTHDIQAVAELLTDIRKGQMVLGDKAYDANWLRDRVVEQGG
jgi:IS5 family transposase